MYLITLFTGGTMFLFFPLVHYSWQLGGLLFIMGVAFGLWGALGDYLNNTFVFLAAGSFICLVALIGGKTPLRKTN
ncbi:hypothetical protein [Melghirimyces algeriensis]|uniref:Uncharacterized protein n=1 Tax=Melghirimyces algeriensis TaxID=910412 RepID=A0A521CBV5_9BACL|nr:hypothetical protein [Melghirimyces algeriensis]SMO56922.1 hypothetical protein SAMN06264849_103250 [Melghirimyces algeriensis]